ncbi:MULTISPECIES: ABC transporter ATP-binding protein [Prochlorococcus]|uniref:ABC transporter ATP-binding protein n=1 Tax=Prochlorococcus TaxID=1218 RepID=UPI0005337DCE|nr:MULTISPECIES: ABC transporter ATP-binding protein [Prochlorococcus]KGG11870.1 ATP-binding protein of ABC transporter [Prochlorococcus marinus str. LG]KGG21823.1 ATP-binding protein of ABC transporter [Prochlorococcus marinus str. SS2]KGG23746.1 ATP-binding protein of ABC transporter [Prochlorococcus marinus str. SS35]KGG32018.1 ATP-binding protein of ABC transporter [Prochlorococcus marinus str. SS51]KGG35291.1 ATP-binding protein of ABC transporter [Prochlorococcus sp. SS52]
MAAFRIDLINRYLKPHRRTLILGAISLLIVNILSVAIPFEVRRVVDALEEGFSFNNILRQAGWIISLATVMGIVRLLSRQLVFGIGRQVEVDLRQRLFDHMLIQDPEWVQKTGSGEVITRATSDIENIRRLLGFAILSLTNTFLAYAFTIPAMLSISPWLTAASVSLYPLMLGTVRLFGGRMIGQRKRQQEALSRLSELIQEDLSGISAIKIYGQEAAEGNAFSKLNINYKNAAINLARTASTLFPLLQGISSISLLLILALGSGLIEKGFLTIGGLIALILYVERLVFPTALLGFTLNTFQLGQVSLERIEELLTNTPLIKDQNQSRRLKLPVKGKLEARGLNISYENDQKEILKNINFVIQPGELVAIVGPVGCGKTTLARALGRMINVSSKQLFLDDIDVVELKLDELRKNISLVPQEGYLFTTTLKNNIRFGVPDETIDKVKLVASQAHLTEDIKGFPDGFETLVGERGITLSGGQRQRTALSRALLTNAPVLVLDDALASVDNKTASAILTSIRTKVNRTILMISHQLSAAAACDRILVLSEGRLVQQGTHESLIKIDGIYKKLWDREKAVEKLDEVK